MEKCIFVQTSVDYLGHTLSKNRVAKGSKVDAVLRMPPPKDVGTQRTFMGSMQFYAKFLLPNLSTTTEPMHKLTSKGQQWNWDKEEQEAFERLKDLLCTYMYNVLAHYDLSLELAIPCDVSEVGIGAVLFTAIPMAVKDQLPMSQRHRLTHSIHVGTVKFISWILLWFLHSRSSINCSMEGTSFGHGPQALLAAFFLAVSYS